ncbi:chemotaxis protein CheA [Sphingomonas rubra]|uniref:Chemotaxis protein CheA n=1 Tax=Sphingomonas rubra TaxID=634430 RepID=A0A1I5SXG0_9SPHN|nr:chemotaxis protein CheW [Sphingomonas rubra]SFP75147.1 two-component system, chemotaxis family, sensor kinase CheA [Sphingomonas rubra]
MDDLLQEFIAETRETLEALSGEIVLWEAAPADRARLDAIFRFVHTVKGSCGFLDLPRLGRLADAAEDTLAAVRDGRRVPDGALVTAVLAIVDRIGELTAALDAGQPLDDTPDDFLVAALAEDAAPPVSPLMQAADSMPGVPVRAAGRSVRLGVELLDRMMAGMSDMVLARNELARRLRDGEIDPRVEAALDRLSATVAEMRDTVTRTRMQRIEALFSPIPRMVRDVAAPLGKQVSLAIEGGDVELDREMIELLRDPFVHIIRNAVDHGIGAPEARRAAGKCETGRLSITARQSGNQILVEIEDDGAGVDTARLARKAVESGLLTEAEAERMSEEDRVSLIFAPGLSSRDTVTALSGRGVGMDVVRANIEQLGGRVRATNRPGQGLTLTMHVPLTLSIIPTIMVGAGAQRFALPRQAIEEIVSLKNSAVRIDHLGAGRVATVRGERLPLADLGTTLGVGGEPTVLAIVATRDGHYALAVDAVLDTEELVVKPAAPAVMASGLFAGQTLPDSGLPLLLLDPGGVAAAAGLRGVVPAAAEDDTAEEQGLTTLLFDDLDGRRRAVALAVVDRVEKVAASAIGDTGGRLHLSLADAVVPLIAQGPLPAHSVTLLRLTDGASEIAYAIAEAQEIVSLPRAIAPARRAGIAGVALVAGEQVELLDAHALFAGEVPMMDCRPLCYLRSDGSDWMDVFLRPVVEAAGYRCVGSEAEAHGASVTLAMDDDPVALADEATVLLSRQPATGGRGIYRYDRAALLAALATRTGKAA